MNILLKYFIFFLLGIIIYYFLFNSPVGQKVIEGFDLGTLGDFNTSSPMYVSTGITLTDGVFDGELTLQQGQIDSGHSDVSTKSDG